MLPAACLRFVHTFCAPVTDCIHVPADDCVEAECPTWFEDSDGDLFGDEESTLVSCVDPGLGWVLQGLDCAPDDAETHPSAVEICDGVRNDCDNEAWVSDDGLVSRLDEASGLWIDASELVATTPPGVSTVADYDLHLRLCPGTYYASFVATPSQLTLEGVADDPALVVLSGNGEDRIVLAQLDSDITLSNLTLIDGSTSLGGGGAVRAGGGSLTVANCVFEGNAAPGSGGAVSAQGVALDISGSVFTGNDASDGGALDAVDCTGTVSAVFEDNEASGQFGGAATLWAEDGE